MGSGLDPVGVVETLCMGSKFQFQKILHASRNQSFQASVWVLFQQSSPAPGAPYPASPGSGCQQDQAGLLSPARDKPFLGQAWARAGVSMRQQWRPWECWQV